MPDSDFIYEAGEPFEIGAHGDHKYEYVAGEAMVDAGKSELVFVSGTGLGGGDEPWQAKVGNTTHGSVTLTDGSTPIDIEHDGGTPTDGVQNFYGARRDSTISATVGQSTWEIIFEAVTFTDNGEDDSQSDNNLALGASVETDLRPFEGDATQNVYYQHSEATVSSGNDEDIDFLAWSDGSDRAGVDFPDIGWFEGAEHDLRFTYDGSDVSLYIDGESSPTATITPGYSTTTFDSMYAWIVIEDDGDSSKGEQGGLGAYTSNTF